MDIMSVLRIRSATIKGAQAIADLWRACNLVMPYNDPETDFTRACAKENSDILVAVTGEDKIVGSVLVGHDGHRGWI